MNVSFLVLMIKTVIPHSLELKRVWYLLLKIVI